MSGSQIGTVVGGIVGSFFGMPQFGMAIGGLIGGAIDPEVIKGPSIGDAQKQTTQAGAPRPVVFGHPAPFMGNIIDGEHKARKIIVEEGGKGGPTVEHERFLLTSAIRICEGPIAGVIRIWRNGEIVYDRRTIEDLSAPDNTSVLERLKYMAEIRAKTAAFQNKVRIYLGTEDQLPDPALEAMHGIGNTPYYRGTAYIVIEDDDVTDTRGACAQYEFEVTSNGDEVPVILVAPSTLNPPTFKNEHHSTNPGAKLFYYPVDSDIGQIFRFFTVSSPYYGHRYKVIPIYGTPPVEHTEDISLVAAEQMSGEIYDSGWWLGEGHSVAEFQAHFPPLGLSSPDPQIGTPPEQTFRTLEAVSGLILVSEFIGGGGPGHNIGSGNVFYPVEFGITATIVPESPNLLIADDGNLYAPDWLAGASLDSIAPFSVPLSTVIVDICSRCEVPSYRLDLTDIASLVVPGFLVATQSTGADCIRPTQQVYFYDMPEFDGLLTAVKRGGASVSEITESDMVDVGPEDDSTRPQALEYPLKVSVVSQDPAADYAPVPQTSSRFSAGVQAKGEVLIQTPVPFSADEAKQRADILHKVLWAQAEGRTEFQLPEEWTRLVPSDCFDMGGKRWFIEDARYADGVVKIRAVYDRASNYTSNATGQAPEPPVLPDTGIRGPTILAVMNLPPLREQDQMAGVYLAATGVLSGWDGCLIQLSIDGGVTYRNVATIGRSSTMGELSAGIGAAPEPVVIDMIADHGLYDSTSDALDLGANAFALVPSAGRAEIGQFLHVGYGPGVDQATLSGIRRGVQFTDASSHSAGEKFVMLNGALFLPVESSLYGSILHFRAVTNGTVPEDNADISFLFLPPLATEHEYLLSEGGDYLTTEAGDRLILE